MKDIYNRTKGEPCNECGGTEYPHNHSSKDNQIVEWRNKLEEIVKDFPFAEFGSYGIQQKLKMLIENILSLQDKQSYRRGFERGKLAELEDSVGAEITIVQETLDKKKNELISTIKKKLPKSIYVNGLRKYNKDIPTVNAFNAYRKEVLKILKEL